LAKAVNAGETMRENETAAAPFRNVLRIMDTSQGGKKGGGEGNPAMF
jgi:hypothetical protein